jgi:sugar O-acyltransferase (sialic acid O-acetyltransferase NeuD family)
MKEKIIIIGGGGHARSILAILKNNRLSNNLLGYTDQNKSNLPLKYLGGDEEVLSRYKNKKIKLVLGVGINLKLREKILKKFHKYKFLSLIDKDSIISTNCKIAEGSVIFPGAVIGPNVKIGPFSVIHNSVVIEHDVSISENSYIGPGAVVCGNVKIEKNVLLGANSTMIQDTSIERNCILGAGSVLIKSYKIKNKSLIGSPAKIKN